MSGVEIILGAVGLALTLPSVVDSLVRLIDSLVSKMESHESTKSFADELQLFTLPVGRARLRQDVALAQKICAADTVSQTQKEELQNLFAGSVQLLTEVSRNVDVVLEKSDRFFSRQRRAALSRLSTNTRKLRTVTDGFHDAVMTQSISAIIPSPKWLSQYDFVTYNAPGTIATLGESSFLTQGRLSKPLAYAKTDEYFLIEHVDVDEAHRQFVETSLEILATRLSGAQIAAGILPFVGLRHADPPSTSGYQLVFRADIQWREAKSLYDLLREEKKPSLTRRVGYCAMLAEAVLHAHTLRLVHKNIRPDNIVISTGSKMGQDRLILIGWPLARVHGGQTMRQGETSIERCLYQHPQRILEITKGDYTMGHDIYSLGVCMIEILTWTPLIESPDGQPKTPSAAFLDLCEELEIGTQADSGESDMCVAFNGPSGRVEMEATDLQRVLEALAKAELPPAAGERLTGVCLRCLNCLDADDGHQAVRIDPFEGRAREDVGADFVDLVLTDIRSVKSMV